MKTSRPARLFAAVLLSSLILTGCASPDWTQTKWDTSTEQPGDTTQDPTGETPAPESAYPDEDASRAGNISGEPYEVVYDPDTFETQRAYPSLRDEFMVPRLGVRAPLVRSTPPVDGWDKVDHAALLASATMVNFHSYAWVTHEEGTAVVALNARDTYDAVGNPLLDPATDEPVLQPDERFILDGVEYAFTTSMRLATADLALNAEPFIKEDGRAVALIYLLNEDGSGSGDVVALVLHRTALQDNPAARFAG